jgi:hypothetical protein
MTAFVKSSCVNQETLETLLKKIVTKDCCYILKWVHEIKLEIERPKNLSPEGQFFTVDIEIRWKKAGDRYQVLSLSTRDFPLEGFQPLEGDWAYKDREAVYYKNTETRIPKAIDLKGAEIGQRYFIDRQTETIHFIALRRVLKP